MTGDEHARRTLQSLKLNEVDVDEFRYCDGLPEPDKSLQGVAVVDSNTLNVYVLDDDNMWAQWPSAHQFMRKIHRDGL